MKHRMRSAEGALQHLRLGRLATLSIDLVGLSHHHDRLDLASPENPGLIHRVALPRYLALLARLDLRATFFLLGADLEMPSLRPHLQAIVAAGHEVASHGFRWTQELPQWSDRSVSEELARAESRFAAHLGVRPVGFRAPGFAVTTRIVRILAERGYDYDSSVFPSPARVARGGAALVVESLRGPGPVRDAFPHPAVMRAPLHPYRPSRFDFSVEGDRKHSLPLWELPVAVTPRLRVPLSGDRLLALPGRLSRRLVLRTLRHAGYFGLRLQGLDLLERGDGDLAPALLRAHPILRTSLAKREARLEALLVALRRNGRLCTLSQAAAALNEAAGPPVVGGDE